MRVMERSCIGWRKDVLASLGAGHQEIEELLRYNVNRFIVDNIGRPSFPLPDEPFVHDWEMYAEEARSAGGIEVLAKYLVQLRFPIQEGISRSEAYIHVTRYGYDLEDESIATDLLGSADQCGIVVHPTPAGRIPLIQAGTRKDFCALVQALTKQNEPVHIPESMGACMVGNYKNWHRFNKYCRVPEMDGGTGFTSYAPPSYDKEQYLDRFIILSSGNYSGVVATDIGLREEKWREASLVIRREHECAHYFTRRVLSSMRNALLDEILADYCGIRAARGGFDAGWLLRFMGLEAFPLYRVGGRSENYLGSPALSPGAFVVLQKLVKRIAENLQIFDDANAQQLSGVQGQVRAMIVLSSLTVEELASEQASEILSQTLANCFPDTFPENPQSRAADPAT